MNSTTHTLSPLRQRFIDDMRSGLVQWYSVDIERSA